MSPSRAATVAVATPCWPAPVSAMTRLLAHAHGKEPLPEAIINFVRASVQQVFALQINARAAEMFREPPGKLQRRRTSREIVQHRIELGAEFRIFAGFRIGSLELFERRDQRFRHVAAAVRPIIVRARPALLWKPRSFRLSVLQISQPISAQPSERVFFVPAALPRHYKHRLHKDSLTESQLATFSGVNPPARNIRAPRFALARQLPVEVFSGAAVLPLVETIQQRALTLDDRRPDEMIEANLSLESL